MTAPILDVHETRMVEAVTRGEPFAGHGCTVAADAIASLLLGRAVKLHAPNTADVVVPTTAAGIRLSDVVIRGVLDLQDGCRAHGTASLPPLILVGCQIPDGVSATRLRIGHFSLSACALGARPGESALDLRDASLGGSLDLSFATLQGDLRANNMRIAGDLLAPCLYIRGRIVLVSMHVGGALDVRGARLARDDDSSELDTRDSNIGGSLKLGSFEERSLEPRRFHSQVPIRLDGVRIAGDLDMSGAAIEDDLNAARIEVGRDVNLGTSWTGRSRFSASGSIVLRHASIGRDLVLSGAMLCGNGSPECMLDMTGARLKGVARFDPALDERGAAPIGFESEILLHMVSAHMMGLNLQGASLNGGLNAQFAEIGTSVALCTWLSKRRAGLRPLALYASNTRGSNTIELRGAKIGGDLLTGGATIAGCLNVADAEIHGSIALNEALDFYDSSITAERLPCSVDSISFEDCRIRNTLRVERLTPASESRVQLNLKNAVVGCLDDNDGSAWGELASLNVSGLRYGRFADPRSPNEHRWRSRCNWLRTPVGAGDVRLETYSPSSYERAAAAFRAEGEDDIARRVILEKLRAERRVRLKESGKGLPNEGRDVLDVARDALLTALRWPRWFMCSLFDVFFGYGMSPGRATITFIGCLMAGVALMEYAAHSSQAGADKPILVVETTAVQNYVAPVENGAGRSMRMRLAFQQQGTGEFADGELPCANSIVPLLYAVDIFVPVLELHQQSQCAFSAKSGAFGWHIWRLSYALLGWIVTSLTVLTYSGVLRRHFERGSTD